MEGVFSKKSFLKHVFCWCLLVIFAVLAQAHSAPAYGAEGILRELSFYGSLKTSANTTVADGEYDVIFKIYDAPTGGNLLWTGTHTDANGNPITITNGFFNTLLGSGTGNTLSLDFNSDAYYLGITVGADSEMTPREQIGASAYAFNADKVDGLDASAFVRSNATTSITASSATTLFTITQSGAGDILNIFDGGTEVFSILDGGYVGIGSSSPSAKLTISDGNLFVGGTITATSTGTSTFAGGINLSSGCYAINDTCIAGSNSITSLGPIGQMQTGSTITLATSTAGIDFAITGAGDTLTFSLPSASSIARGLLTSLDWTTFNTKVSTTSIDTIAELETLTGADIVTVTADDITAVELLSIVNGDTGTGNLVFSASPAFTGSVGIGTTTPTTTLVVVPTVAGGGIYIDGSIADNINPTLRLDLGSTQYTTLTTASANTSSLADSLTGDTILKNRNANALLFGTDNLERMRITASGDVGIGTANPQEMLDVRGLITGGTGFDTHKNYIDLQNAGDGLAALTFGLDGGSVIKMMHADDMGVGNNTALIQFQPLDSSEYGYLETYGAAGLIVGTGDDTPIIFRPGRTEAARISSTGLLLAGPLGIGTTTNQGTGIDISDNGGDANYLSLHTVSSGYATTDGFEFSQSGLEGFVWNYENAAVRMGTNNIERLTITGDGNIGIGTSSPLAKLSIAGGNLFVGGTITATSTATSTFSGPLSAQAFNLDFADSRNHHLIYVNGVPLASASSTSYSTFFGVHAGTSTTASTWESSDNTGFGAYALSSTIPGNSAGTENTAVGAWALQHNVSGYNNTAVGALALNRSGSNDNTAVGLSAFENTTGWGNAGLGNLAGYNNTTGSQLTLMGTYTDVLVDGLSKAGAIGYAAKVGTSSALVLGGTGSDAVTVGIGTTSPYARLSIHTNNGDTVPTLFSIGSSTASATTTLFSISNTGSTTAQNGFNITAGCFAKNGICLDADFATFGNKLGTTSIDISSELAGIVTDETGNGALVFANSATLSSTTLTGLTTLGNATSSTFFSTTASSTNLFSQNAFFNNSTTTGVSYFDGQMRIGTSTLFGAANASSTKLVLAGGTFLQQQATGTTFIVGGVKDASTLNGAGSVFVSGKYAYVANTQDDSLRIIDVSNPALPVMLGGVKDAVNLNSAQSVFVSGKYAYVASSLDDSVRIIDVSNPTSPVMMGGVRDTNLNGVTSVFVSGKYAYAANSSDNSLRIIDVSNPASPTIVGGVKDNTDLAGAYAVYVSGKYAYVANANNHSMRIIDVSNPASPTIVGGVRDATDLQGIFSVYVSGKYAYVANVSDQSMRIIDVSNPASPTIVGGVKDIVNLNGSYSVFVSGKYAYVTSNVNDSLSIIDVSSSTSPVIVGEVKDATNLNGAQSVFVSGKYAYVANANDDSLRIIDIGGIDAPAATIGTIAAGNITVSEQLSVSGGGYFNSLNTGSGGLYAGGLSSIFADASTTLAASPALSILSNDNSVSSIVDVLSLGHTATGTIANGIGTGLLFSTEYAGTVTASTTATSTARIAALLTDVTASSPASALSFYTKSGTTDLAERMRLSATGYLGIGTTSPYAKLSVHANTGDTATTLFAIGSSTASGTTTLFSVLNTGDVDITGDVTVAGSMDVTQLSSDNYFGQGDILDWNADGDGGIFLRTSGAYSLAIPSVGTGAGNVGVGTSTPLAKLTVSANAGESNTTLFAVSSSTASGVTATLFRVLNAGGVITGNSASLTTTNIQGTDATPLFQISASGAEASSLIQRYSANATPGRLLFLKTRGASSSDFSAVSAADQLGAISFAGGNGTEAAEGAQIRAYTTATNSGDNYTAGALGLWTSPGGATAPTERLTVYSNGDIGIGTTTPEANLHVHGSGSGSYTAEGYASLVTITAPDNNPFGILFQNTSTGTTTDAGIYHNGTGLRFGVSLPNGSLSSPLEVTNQGIQLTSQASSNNPLTFLSHAGTDYGTLSGTGSYFSLGWTSDPAATSTPVLSWTTGNRVGIGTTSPTAQFTTTGSVRFATFGAGSLVTDANGNLSLSSDERLKNIEGSFTKGLTEILGIEPISYKWKTETGFDTEGVYTGFSAQNVQLFIPEAVGEDRRGFLSLSDRPLLAAVINAIKEMYTTLTAHTTRIETLESEIESLRNEVEELRNEEGGGDEPEPPATPPEENPPTPEPDVAPDTMPDTPLEENPPAEEPVIPTPEPTPEPPAEEPLPEPSV